MTMKQGLLVGAQEHAEFSARHWTAKGSGFGGCQGFFKATQESTTGIGNSAEEIKHAVAAALEVVGRRWKAGYEVETGIPCLEYIFGIHTDSWVDEEVLGHMEERKAHMWQ